MIHMWHFYFRTTAKTKICLVFSYVHIILHAQLKQAEGQSEVAKQRELQKKIEQLRSEISHLDSQISGTEEQLATQG